MYEVQQIENLSPVVARARWRSHHRDGLIHQAQAWGQSFYQIRQSQREVRKGPERKNKGRVPASDLVR